MPDTYSIKIIPRTVALDGSAVTDDLPSSFFNAENTAHTFVITAQRHNEIIALSGTVSAVFLNANDETIPITGSSVCRISSDGKAVVTLPNECYYVNGRFTLTINIDGAVIYEGRSQIRRRSSATGYNPTSVFDVTTLASDIAAMEAATVQTRIATNAANAVVNDIIVGQPLELNWVVGNIDSQTGENKPNYTTRLRIEEYIYSENGISAVIPNDMQAYWYKYSGNSAATFIESAGTWIDTGSFSVPGGYYYRFTLSYQEEGVDIEPSAGSNVIIMDYKYADATLTQPGKAADAKVTGEIFSSYDESIVPLYEKNETGSSGGITYVWNGNSISMSGTVTATAFFQHLFLYSSSEVHNIPWIKKGNVYHLKLSRTAADGARIRIRTYMGENRNIQVDYFRFSEDATFTLQHADELTYIEIDAYAANGDTVNNTLTYELLVSPSLQYLAKKSFGEPLKLRVMQNNIGVFRFGRNPGSGNYTHYEHTTEEAAQKLQNYKDFYSELKPDILCLQEFYYFIGPNNTLNVKDNLYNKLFAFNEDENLNNDKQRAIFGNLPCVLDGLKTVTSGGSSLEFMEMTILAYNIHVITTALKPTANGVSHVETRQNQLDALMAYCDRYTNAILCLDLNVDSDSELTTFLSEGEDHGFHSAVNSDFWGKYNTYMNPASNTTSNYFRKIDAIWAKGYMKMVNAKVLLDESTDFPDNYVWNPSEVVDLVKPLMISSSPYNHLASDHIPVMADIVVYR